MRMPATLLVAMLACAACPREQQKTDATTHSATPVTEPIAAKADAGSQDAGSRAAEEACVDAWISKNHLDQFGSPEGTMYTGGTPLFNEATGERTDRLEYIYAHHPDVKQSCAPGLR